MLALGRAAAGVLAGVVAWCDVWVAQGFGPSRDAWRARARVLGREVAARLPHETIHGVARDLAADGALILDLPDGQERRIAAGDVFPLEAQG